MALETMGPTSGAPETRQTEAQHLAEVLGSLADVAESLDTRLFNFLSRMNGANEPRGGSDLEPTEGFFPSVFVLARKVGQALEGAQATMDRLEQLV